MEVIERFFSFPPHGCYRFYRWVSERVSSWKACMELPAVQRNSTHLRTCLPDGPAWAASCWFSHPEKPLELSWLLHGDRDTDCAVGTSAGKLGGSWVPVFAHEQLWIASHFSVVPMHSFLSPWFWPGNKPCASNWVGLIGPKNTAVSPS